MPVLVSASSDSGRTRLIGIATIVVVIVALRMSRPVSMPVIAGLLVAAMAWPVRRWCERFMPRPLALLTTVLLVSAIALSLVAAIGWGGAEVGSRILERRDRLESLHRQASGAASRVGVRLPDLPGDGAGRGRSTPPPTPAAGGASQRSPAARAMAAAFSGLGLLALTIGFSALAMAEARDVRLRVRRRFPKEKAERILGISEEAARAVRRYVGVKALTSAITGSATLVIALAFGLDLALLWGALTFLLEFVPSVGSVLSVIPPVLYSFVQFDSLGRPLALAAALTVAQLTLGNYVDPRIEGRMLSLSPFVVLASIILWAWIWGPPGALLGVPITVALLTVAKHFESSHWVWALLNASHADEAGPAPAAPAGPPDEPRP